MLTDEVWGLKTVFPFLLAYSFSSANPFPKALEYLNSHGEIEDIVAVFCAY